MVVSPSTQIPNGETLNGDGENINGSSARGGGTGGAPTSADRGYEARQRELDQLLEGMLCNVQDIPDLKSQFCPSVDIDSIPSELNRVCPPSSAGDRYDGKPVHENGSVMNGGAVGGFHTPSRHHSMRDEFLRSRVPQQRPRAKPAPPTVDPEWASLLMREFEPASRRHNERTRAHSETRNPYIPEVSFDDFNFSDFDSPPISHGSARRNNPLNNYNAWDRRPSASSSTTTSRQTSRKDSLESSQDRSVAEFLNRHPSQHEGKLAGPDRGNHRQDVIDCRDLDELSEEFAAELSSLHHQSQPQPVHQQQQQRYVLETSSERKTYGPVDMWEPTPSQSMTWLQKQQQKLRERREARYRSERSPQEIKLISELKGVQSRMKVVGDHMKPSSSTVATIYDDPPSPSALTSRASPAKQVTQPLNIRVNFNEGSRASPAKTVQNIQHELDDALKSTQQNFGLQRNGSQTSYDRQRSQDSSRSLEEDLEQVILQAQQEIAARNVRAESVERTSTPNFPVCPGTPYLNQNDPRRQQELSNGNLKNPSSYSPSSSSGFSAATGGPLSSNDSGFGGTPVLSEKLPPKSPPSSRRIKWGLQLVRSDSGKKKKAGSGYGSDSTSTTPGLLAEANETPPAGTSAPPPPPPLPPPPPVTPPGDANDTLRNLLRPAYLRSLSSEDDEDAVAKLNESRDSSLDTSKGSSEMGQPNGHVNSICATNTGPATSSASSRTDGSGMSSFQQQRIRPEDIEPPGPGNPVTFVNDLSSFWYKQTISREDAIQVLRDQEPGTFLVRDSTSFPGAFGLALKVGPSTGGTLGKKDTSSESVRHFLIESTTSGVRIKGCQNEPVFGSLSALVYQHSVTPLALPCKLVLPDCDLTENKHLESVEASALATQKLLHQGAACNVIYLHSIDVESLTGPQAVRKTVYAYLSRCDSGVLHPPLSIHFKVSTQGITITDNERLVFFRRHYPIEAVSFCGVDPEERKWKPDAKDTKFGMLTQRQYFGFVARKPGTLADNQCHIFVQLEPEQPATAIINFVNKVMQAYASDQTNRRFV